MTDVVYLIERLSPGLYLLCGAIFVLALRRLMMARGEMRLAEFELERELARSRQSGAITLALLIVEVALAVFAISTVVAPTMRQDIVAQSSGQPGSVPEDFRTSTPGGTGEEMDAMLATVTAQVVAGSGGPALQLTAAPSATPVGTIIAGLGDPEGCDSDEARLEVPANGMRVFDTLSVAGTAFTDNFAFYKFEMSGPSTGDQFVPVGVNQTSPVRELGALGQVSLAPFQFGQYKFRLAVFDNTTALKAFCMVNIMITERPPTATPPGGS